MDNLLCERRPRLGESVFLWDGFRPGRVIGLIGGEVRWSDGHTATLDRFHVWLLDEGKREVCNRSDFVLLAELRLAVPALRQPMAGP